MGARKWECGGVQILLPQGVEVRDFGDREPKIGIRFKYKGVACRELSLSAANPKTATANISLAHAKLITVRDEIERGVFKYGEHFPDSKRCGLFGEVVTKGMLVKAILDDYEAHARRTLDPGTLLQYQGRLNCHIRPYWDKKPLALFSRAEVVNFIEVLAEPDERGKGILLGSARQILVPLVAAVERAVAKGVLKHNPFSDISLAAEWPKDQRKSDYAPWPFNQQEREAIMAAASRAWRLMVTVWVWGGYRPEEIVALKWSEVDFTKERLHVCRVNVRGEIAERAKTEAGLRYVPMIGPVKKALREQRELTGLKPHGFVFENPTTGAPWEWSSTPGESQWPGLLQKAGVAYRSIKQLRHTFVSMMLKNGEAIETVSRIVGHKHSGITREFYARMIEEVTATNAHGFALRGDYSKAVA